jgi:glycine/D-amino acid oxidase-like deaminating enzyme
VSEIQTCFAFDMPYGFIYGFPSFSNSRDIKVAIHKPGAVVVDPNQIDRHLTSLDHQLVSQFLGEVLPDVDPIPTEGSVCMYTMTPDEHFVIDEHPRFKHVFFAAGFSGHGFKFAPVVGKMASDWVSGAELLELRDFIRIREGLF